MKVARGAKAASFLGLVLAQGLFMEFSALLTAGFVGLVDVFDLSGRTSYYYFREMFNLYLHSL